MAAPSGEQLPPCSQSAADTAPLVRTRAPHGARANRGRTREASSAVRTKLSAWRPLFRNGCETGGFTSVLRSWVKAMAASAALLVVVALFSTAWLAAVASRDRGAVVVWAVAPLFAAAILLGVLFFFAHRAGRRAVNDLDFKLEHPPTAAVQVVAPPPAADVELVAP